jgi:hypothetical protein
MIKFNTQTKEGRVAEYLDRKCRQAIKVVESQALAKLQAERAEYQRTAPPRQARESVQGTTAYVDCFKYDTGKWFTDKSGEMKMIRRKLFVGNIINTAGSHRSRITVTKRRGEFHFTQHQERFEPTKDVVINGEITPDQDSCRWVDKHPTKPLKIGEVCELMARWGMTPEEIYGAIDEATSFDMAFA